MNNIKLQYKTQRILTKVTNYSMCALLLILVIKGWMVSFDDYNEAKQQYRSEMECVAKLISNGVERINIATHNGTCSVKTNGYYNSYN